MKKLFLSILAVVTLASCTKDESIFTELDSEIKLAPVAAMTTKGNVQKVIDGTTYPTDENFGVKAYWSTDGAGSDFSTAEDIIEYLGGSENGPVEFYNKGGNYWGGTTTYYWPKNGSLRFAAYSPYMYNDLTTKINAQHILATDTYTITNFQQDNNTANTIDLLVAPTTLSYTSQTAAEKVSVVFEHTQAWISINVKATDVANGKYKLRALTIQDVITKGTLTANMNEKTQTWVYDNNSKKDYEVFAGSYDVTTDVALKENNDKGTLVIPQATTTLKIEFDQNKDGDVPALYKQSLIIPLVLDAKDAKWEAGKHYIYTIIFDRDEILINPSVVDWEDVYVNDVPATEIEVEDEEQFIEAVNKSTQIRLVKDINLTSTYRINKSLNLDLNGHKITSEINDILFRVNNGATFTIGRGEILNKNHFIVSVNAGGTVIINDGNYTASTTVVNVNGGKAYINGGYFVDKDEYNGQYLINHIDAMKDSGLIEITGGTFVNFNPAEASSESPAMNFVKAGYKVESTVVGAKTEYKVVKEN